MKNLNDNFLNERTSSFQSSFAPWGYLDGKRAVEIAYEIGKNEDWLVDEIQQFSDDCDIPLDKIDPCYIAYESILQFSRNKIEELTGFDFLNDSTSGDLYTFSNYLDSRYDCTETTAQEISERLKNAETVKSDLDQMTLWFLEQLEIQLQEGCDD